MNRATEVLTLAKEILENEVEWCQEHLYVHDINDDNNKIISACAVGAIDLAWGRVVGETDLSWSEMIMISQEAESRYLAQVPYDSIPEFNDNVCTSKEDVLLAFKRAIGM